MWKTYIFTFAIFYIDVINANCVLNVNEDLNKNHPLILSGHDDKWISLSHSSKGSVDIERDEIVRFACPSTTSSKNNPFKSTELRSQVVSAKCKSGKEFLINEKTYKFSDLMCSSPPEFTEMSTGQQCLGSDTELIKIGFKIDKDFITEYTVCFNKKEKLTLYTEVTVSGDIDKAVTPKYDQNWLTSQSQFGNVDVDSAYVSSNQVKTFKKILNKDFFDKDRCYLEKGKLVSNSDLLFLPEQASTSHYLNAVPQWSTCNRKNWIEIEKRVKNLAKSFNRPLTVYTGTYRKMSLPAKWGFSHKDMYLHYNSDSDKAIPVPLYIWKVVHDPHSQKSVAIIQINNPHLTLTDIDSFVLCDDICKNVNWLNFLERKTIVDGYTYCCDLPNFEFGFAFKKSPFPKARGGILRDDNYKSG